MAWQHQHDGFGLEAQPWGTFCRQPTTQAKCGCAVLRTFDLAWDVLRDANGAATPVQAESEPGNPARFNAPVDPGDEGGVLPPPDEPQDFQEWLDDWLAGNEAAQKYFEKLFYIARRRGAAPGCGSQARLQSLRSVERHLTVAAVTKPLFGVLFEAFLALAATQPKRL